MDWLKGVFYVVLMFFDALPLIPKLSLLIMIVMCSFFLLLTLTSTYLR